MLLKGSSLKYVLLKKVTIAIAIASQIFIEYLKVVRIKGIVNGKVDQIVHCWIKVDQVV